MYFKRSILYSALSACAHLAAPLHPRTLIVFPETEVRAGPPAQVAIADLNEAELMAGGTAAYAAEDFNKAANYFERLVDSFPGSEKRLPAAYDAGLARQKMGDHAAAKARFELVIAADTANGEVGSDGLDALQRVAECEYSLGQFSEAAATLARLIARADLPLARRADVATQRGVCLWKAHRLGEGEDQLRAALALYKSGDALDGSASQAQFYLAETFRTYFEELTLNPSAASEKELTDQLESKAQMLLSAQGHYLRCIRLGDPEWATASGFRIGELFEHFHAAMVDAPVPKDLDAEQQDAYRAELKQRVRVLVTKAIEAYEKTLAAAERVNATNPFIEKTRASLERLKAFLLETKVGLSASSSFEHFGLD